MKARNNPLTKLEAFMQRIIEGPFAWLFPSKLEPVEIERKLERELEDNTLLQGEGRRLGPDVYDVYLSIKDHQQLSPSQGALIRDWQNHLIEFARQRRYTLKNVPTIRLHSDTSLRAGLVRMESSMADQNNVPSTMQLSKEQLDQIRSQMAAGQSLPGIDKPLQHQGGVQHQGGMPQRVPPSNPGLSNPNLVQAPAMPQAWLTIRLPQAGQQTYRIEKPIVNIGRQLTNDIIVEDKRVSRHHAQIKFQPDGQFAIYDLGSTNGITINSTPHMRQHVLRNGDRFTIGSYDFYFERR